MQFLGEKVLPKCDFHADFSANVNNVVYQTDKHQKVKISWET